MSSGSRKRHCFGGNVFFSSILVVLINLKISNLGHYSPLCGHGGLSVTFGPQMVKGIYLSKALTCMKLFLYKQKCFFLSRRRIPWATLL